MVLSLKSSIVSNRILRFIQPHRNSDGQEGKFEAHYKYCGVPGVALRKKFESMGYEIETYTSFVGHEYYKRIRPLAAIERALRPIIVKAELPFISANLLILRKPLNS